MKQWGSALSTIRHDDEDDSWSSEGPTKILIRENDFKVYSKIKHAMLFVKNWTELNDVVNSTLLSDSHYATTETKDEVITNTRNLIYDKLALDDRTESNEKRNHKLLDKLKDLDDDEILGLVSLEEKIRNMDDKGYAHAGDCIDSDGNRISIKHNHLINDWAFPTNDAYANRWFDHTDNGSIRADEYLGLINESREQGIRFTDVPDMLVFSNSDGEYLTMSEQDEHQPTSDDMSMALALNPEDTVFLVDAAVPWMD